MLGGFTALQLKIKGAEAKRGERDEAVETLRKAEVLLLAGKDQYKYIRAFFGMGACTIIGVTATLASEARPLKEVRGLVWGTVSDAIERYKGAPGSETESVWASAQPVLAASDAVQGEAQLPVARITEGLARALGGAQAGDLVYVSDARPWLGGLRSGHAVISDVTPGDEARIELGPLMWEIVFSLTRSKSKSGR